MTDQIPLPIDEELYGRAFGQLDGPIHWPSLTADERTVRSNELGGWVEKLVARFDIDVLRDPPHRGTYRYVSRKYWDELSKDLKPIYQAPTVEAAAAALDALEEKWGARCPAMIRLWRNAWSEFIPFLDYDVEIRRVLHTAKAIESLNARFRRAVRARGHFPNEQSAMKTLYLVVRSLDPKGTGQTRWAMRWKPALNVRHHLLRPHARVRVQLKMKPPLTPLER